MTGAELGSFIDNLKKKAEDGAADSAYLLALKYLEGTEVKKDIDEAAKWIRTAANRGYADAQYKLGQFHEQGQGVTKSQTLAAMWYMIAGNNSHEEALQRLTNIMANLPEEEQEEVERMASSFVPE